ncbi:MAG: hypothetical protein IJN91_01795 [Alphaproteobacteria bacterium]|nr:hypothetical protein [Alphaproteobacteria bacterium]
MNKKILLGSIFTISIIGITRAETTDLNTIIGTVKGDDYTKDASTMTFSVDYGSAGVITGRAQCSSQSGIGMWNGASTSDEITIRASLPDSSGQYCYCTLDGYTPVGGAAQVLSAPWVFRYDRGAADNCADYCALYCARGLLWGDDSSGLAFRSAVFNAVETPIIITPSTISCELGYYLPAGTTECAICPANSYCAGGEYEKSETADSGILPCDSGLISPTGMWQAEQCGHALHIGDSVLYLRQSQQTEHALHIQQGNDIFYGNATTADVPMNINTNHRLKVQHNNVIYSIYDDTIELDN